MTGSLVLWGKLALSALLALLGAWALGRPRLHAGPWPAFVARLMLSAAGARAALFAAVYLWLGLSATSDLVPYYYEPSRRLLSGESLWYAENPRLFYGPFFPYLTALPLLVHDSPVSIVALMILIELAALRCWLAVGHALCGDAVARRAGIAYVLFPFTLLTAVLGANNDVLVSLFIAAALLLFARGAEKMSGVMLGAGVLASKLLAGLAGPALMLAARAPIAWLSITGGSVLVVYAALTISGADFLSPLLFHGGADYSSGTLPFVLDALGAGILLSNRLAGNITAAAALVCALALPWWLGSRRLPRAAIPAVLGMTTLVVMLMSVKAYPHYLLCTLFALFLVWCSSPWRRIDSVMFILFGVLVSVESSLWFRWLHNKRVVEAAADPAIGRGYAALFMAVEIALLGCYAWLLALCVRDLRRVVRGAGEER